jgi:pimeloyl-ACP methyl ester carboxylesterase
MGEHSGCQQAMLVGNSAGCAPALVFAATHPDRVQSAAVAWLDGRVHGWR